MIPADHITIDGDTALVVVECPHDSAPAVWEQADKPCDTCGKMFDSDIRKVTCPACDGTGCHTIDIEAEWADGQRTPPQRLRVHVLDVLPIRNLDSPGQFQVWTCDGCHDEGDGYVICEGHTETLPSAAAPGMWAIRLAVHTPENVECRTCDGNGRLTELVERALAVDLFTTTTTPENVEEPT